MNTRANRRIAVGVLASIALCGVAVAAGPAAAVHGRWHVRTLPGKGAASFSEPGVGIGPHGHVLVNACTANSGAQATYWRSSTHGIAWSRAFTIGKSPIGCGDSDAVFGSDGYQYSLILATGVDVYVKPPGHGWTGPSAFSPPHGTDQPDRPWLLTSPDHPATVYMFNSEVSGNIIEWISTNHAKRFTGPIRVTGGANAEAALALGSRPLIDPRNSQRMYLYYETASIAGLRDAVLHSSWPQFPLSQLWQASSTDGGRKWTNHLVVDAKRFGSSTGTLGHLLPASAIDRRGRRYVTLSVQRGTSPKTGIYLMHSRLGGGWSSPVRIDARAGSAVMPALAAAAPGRLYLSWYASGADDFNAMHAHWNEVVAVTRNGLSNHPIFRRVRLNDDPVHIGPIEMMGAVGNDLGKNWSMRDFQGIATDGCGRPYVVWADDHARPRTYFATTGRCAS
jgi:hypothetical protein